jgi:pilus assembly protein CpaC
MRRFIRIGLLSLSAAIMAAPSAFAAAQLTDDGANSARVVVVSTKNGTPAHQRITLGLGKAAIVEIDADARDVLVSNPDIVDAVVRTPRRIFLMGQKGGQTNAFFFDAQGKQLASIDIRVEKDVTDLSKLIHISFPDTDIKATAINDTVVLTGHVGSAAESLRAQDITSKFAGDDKKVVNVLQIGSSDQVMLKVRVAEMQRSVAKQFGINAAAAGFAGAFPLAASTENQFSLVGHALGDLSGAGVGQVCSAASTTGNPVGALVMNNGVCQIRNNFQASLQALERVGLVHILAEPNLTAVSGETAKFLAGGEFPVPVARDRDGNVTVSFKQFGVGLSFTPVVLGPGRISLQLSTEVSELSNAGAFNLASTTSTNAFTIPALSVRRAETTVEVPSGGSFAIAGLMQHTTKQVLDAFPGVKDMPIIGALFRSRDFSNEETELVVLVTAYLVKPTQEAKLVAPTDGFVPPTDLETILLGRLNAVYAQDKSSARAEAPAGYIVQ